MNAKKSLTGMFLGIILVCLTSIPSMAATVCFQWDWQDPNNLSLSDVVQFKIYYSDVPGPVFVGTFVTQGPSPVLVASPNTNGSTWSSCVNMPTATNSYYTLTATVPGYPETEYSNVVYVDFNAPSPVSDNSPFHIANFY